MIDSEDPDRSAPTTDAERLRVCREALEQIARLQFGPEPFVGCYTRAGCFREMAIVGEAQSALLHCWPDMDRIPEPLDLEAETAWTWAQESGAR